jgi:hypothetical protein
MAGFVINFNDSKPSVPINNPDALRWFSRNFTTALRRILVDLSKSMIRDLKMAYDREEGLQPRDRDDGLTQLKDSLNQALYASVLTGGTHRYPTIHMQVYNLQMMRDATSRPGDNFVPRKGAKGWFDLFEETFNRSANPPPARHGATSEYAFVWKGQAITIARDIAGRLDMDKYEAVHLMTYAAMVFSGKHDEGIMVDLSRPIFYGYVNADDEPDAAVRSFMPADFGLKPHLGVKTTHVWQRVLLNDGTVHAVIDAINRAKVEAVNQLRTQLPRRPL